MQIIIFLGNSQADKKSVTRVFLCPLMKSQIIIIIIANWYIKKKLLKETGQLVQFGDPILKNVLLQANIFNI